ncbi:class I SAM-dependent methyltransferase [Shinella kummerowiae]|uniref:Methyltransferase domain-containing protein n=1 Tax=Shinella kummerowiae TaxID=417745 RepID=A0A6N8SJD6_9HYPH|nr:cyclopropane-fatty-acyl-phospholipid synthase family protein [Shinella kummerowiae]MXN49164.1 methyltransferase domain-containing protein [Shinella kummerowiae]
MAALARIFRRGLGENRAKIGVFARAMNAVIASVDIGKITVVLPSGERSEHIGTRPGPSAAINIHRWRAVRRLATGGDLGFAEAYIDGDWSTPDLEACLELAARNIDMLDGKISGHLAVRLLHRFRHALRANNKTGSRKNIAYHYDLGNAFYREWLDPSMTYSSALYTEPALSLEEAQRAKIERVKQLLSIKGGEQILEIGCGWGALAASLAHAGATVDGVTLSSAQLDHATECIRANGQQEAVRLELKDYRDVTGSFDRIVSIEMLEAVGEAYWPLFFKTLQQRLRAGGHAVLQVITIDESRFAAYRGSADFIQRHVFPGGMLPTKSIIQAQAANAGLRMVQCEYFGSDYARTLLEWRKRFRAAWPRISALGYSEQFHRLWDYYLCYCAAGFKAGTINVGLYVLERPADPIRARRDTAALIPTLPGN